MTTKKQSTPNDHGSKDDSFREAQRQDQRVSELWRPSSPTMHEVFASIRGLRTSLDEALKDVDSFVSESERVSGALREEGYISKADSLAKWADEWSKVTSKEFRVGATKLVDVVRNALVTGYPDHVVMMAKRIRSRHLAEWGRLCRSARYALRTDTPILSEEQIQGRRLFAASLIEDLTRIDGRAEKFKADQVIEVANNKKMTTDAGFAGKLACMCGALEYKSGDQEKAQEAFRHALRGRRLTPNDVSG